MKIAASLFAFPKRLGTVFCLLTVLSCPAISPADGDPIRGSVAHFDMAKGWIPDERLPIIDWKKHVAPHLKAGISWSDKLLPSEGTEVKWVPIPAWLAGHWHIDKARFVLDKTGQAAPESTNLEDDVFGYQQDRLGGYWEMMRSPVTNMTEGDKFYSRFIHYEQSGSKKSESQFVLESDNMEVRVAKMDGRIFTVRKRHDVYVWTMTPSGVEADDHVQFLDNGMRPKESGSGVVKAKPTKVGPYQRVDVTSDGFRARESFKLFLEKNGFKDLVPLD